MWSEVRSWPSRHSPSAPSAHRPCRKPHSARVGSFAPIPPRACGLCLWGQSQCRPLGLCLASTPQALTCPSRAPPVPGSSLSPLSCSRKGSFWSSGQSARTCSVGQFLSAAPLSSRELEHCSTPASPMPEPAQGSQLGMAGLSYGKERGCPLAPKTPVLPHICVCEAHGVSLRAGTISAHPLAPCDALPGLGHGLSPVLSGPLSVPLWDMHMSTGLGAEPEHRARSKP